MAITLLLADDDDSIALLLEHAIHRCGHDVTLKWVSDGEGAIQYLTHIGTFAHTTKYPIPAALLLDLKMPKVNGFEVLEWKRKQPHLEALPVVVLSSSELPQDKERAFALGANAYFVKPMELTGFEDIIIRLEQYQAILKSS